jgi:hypothetical protein
MQAEVRCGGGKKGPGRTWATAMKTLKLFLGDYRSRPGSSGSSIDRFRYRLLCGAQSTFSSPGLLISRLKRLGGAFGDLEMDVDRGYGETLRFGQRPVSHP